MAPKHNVLQFLLMDFFRPDLQLQLTVRREFADIYDSLYLFSDVSLDGFAVTDPEASRSLTNGSVAASVVFPKCYWLSENKLLDPQKTYCHSGGEAW